MAFQGMTDTNETRPQFIPDSPSTQRRVAEQTYDGSITKGPEDERLSGALAAALHHIAETATRLTSCSQKDAASLPTHLIIALLNNRLREVSQPTNQPTNNSAKS